MKKIKFRVWDKRDKRMYYSPDFDIKFGRKGTKVALGHTKRHGGEGAISPKTDDIKIMQFTGLKDKNNKEIYEGDIVEFGKTTDDNRILGEIYWKDELAGFGFKLNRAVLMGMDDLKPENVEVVGNIYENPELSRGS